VLGAIVAIAATRAARLTASPARPRSSRLARFFERNRVPTAVTVGIRMVFQPPQPGATASVWPALAGASVAIVGLIGVGVFSASLRHLVATPAAYGQSWEMTVYDFAHQAPASRPCTPVGTPVASYSAIEAIAHSCAQGVTVDGHSMGAISVTPLRGIMHPTVLGGRLPRSRDEVALGSDTLQTLHRNIGDSITVPSTRGRARYRVVGRVIVPTLSVSDPQAIADGAVFTGAGLDRIADIEGNTTIALTIRLRPGVDKAAAAARVAELAGVAHLDGPFAPTERVETPLEVIRLDQIRRVPAALAVFLAVLGAIAVGHLLVTSVRQQRRSFAVLKSMGFNRRQLMATVACEATTIVSLAILIGVVIGAVAGAVAWRAVARDVGVVPGVSFPVAILVAYALVALVVANVLATLPARTAARTPAAAILRAE
jgi:hypothetical protein